MLLVLKNIDPDKIIKEKNRIMGTEKRKPPKETIGDQKRNAGVLIVDDAAIMRELIKNTLLTYKIPVLAEAENGRLALEKYKELLPEVVILDIDMPEMDGFEALAEIRAFDPQAQVMMCSQVTKQSTVDDAIKLGAVSFIAKPIKTETLIGAVNKIIGKK
jgi:two-component system chemotaxis response regulator CheY